MKRKLLVILLAMAMAISMMPAMAFASSGQGETYPAVEPLSFTAVGGDIEVKMDTPFAWYVLYDNNPKLYDDVSECVWDEKEHALPKLQYSTGTVNEQGELIWKDFSIGYKEGQGFVVPEGETYYVRRNPSESGALNYENSRNMLAFHLTTEDDGATCQAGGSAMSLLDSTKNIGVIPEYGLLDLFRYCDLLTKAPKVDATEVGEAGCHGMFAECDDLVDIPQLPATKIGKNGYREMFCQCKSLVDATIDLPALDISFGCYATMFSECPNLVYAPRILAKTGADYAFSNMFCDCSSLKVVPEISVEQLTPYCFFYMFDGCSSLKYLKVNFKDWLPANKWATSAWLQDVPSKGIFDCPAELDTTKRGEDTVPAGWVVSPGMNVTFDTLGGTKVDSQIVPYKGKVAEPTPAPTRNGYTFMGWYHDSDFQIPWDFDNDVVAGDTTIYAKWSANQYKIVLDPNAPGTLGSLLLDYDREYALPNTTFTRSMYSLIGWSTNPDGSGVFYANGEEIKNLLTGGSMTLYAQWAPIKNVKMSKLKYAKIAAQSYSGKAKRPALTVTYDGKVLKAGRDYVAVYQDNVKVGTAKVTVVGQGIYVGSKELTFKINPKATSFDKLKKYYNGFYGYVKKSTSKNSSGYQLRYSKYPDMSKAVKKTVSKNYKDTYFDISGLKSQTTYYVQTRVIKKASDGKTYYSAWSKAKKVVTK